VPKAPEVQEPRVLLGEGERLFRDKKYEEARSKYLAAAEGDANLKDIQLCLLKVNFALGDYERAAAALEKIFTAQKVEEDGADAYSLPITGSYGDAAELSKHLQALIDACAARPLSDKPWLLLGAIQYGRRNYADARDALQRYVENTLSPAKPNGAALKLLESAKKLAK
jgi:tetratricopeptide (TPR) repeat protein